MKPLRAPFPYAGYKGDVAAEVWRRFGDQPHNNPNNYVEPFAGTLAMLIGRPLPGPIETVNDFSGFIVNFWRAVQAAPEEVAKYADWPVFENCLHARHVWLMQQQDNLVAHLEGDPDFYNAKIAGWWAWGMSCWIAQGWCSGEGPWQAVDGKLVRLEKGERRSGKGITRQLPTMVGGQGVHAQLGITRKLPTLKSSAGVNSNHGVMRKAPHLSNGGQGVNRVSLIEGDDYVPDFDNAGLVDTLRRLASRLRSDTARVRVTCGDWARILGPAVTTGNGMTAIFLDPPYDPKEHSFGYDSGMGESNSEHGSIFADVRAWAIANGDNPLMRIALCGYDDGHKFPEGWKTFRWKARGGYSVQGSKDSRGKKNAGRETIWFSPACIDPQQSARDAFSRPITLRPATADLGPLFSMAEATEEG